MIKVHALELDGHMFQRKKLNQMSLCSLNKKTA
jgi:hypothetical protein